MGSHDLVSDLTEITHFDIARRYVFIRFRLDIGNWLWEELNLEIGFLLSIYEKSCNGHISDYILTYRPWKPANYRPLLGSESDDDFKESSSAHSVKSKLSTKKRLKLAGGSRKSSEAKIADSVQLELPSPLILKPQGILSEDYDCELFSKVKPINLFLTNFIKSYFNAEEFSTTPINSRKGH